MAIGGGFGGFRDKETQRTDPNTFGGDGKGGTARAKPVVEIRDKQAEEEAQAQLQAKAKTGRVGNILAGGLYVGAGGQQMGGGSAALLGSGRSYRRALLGV